MFSRFINVTSVVQHAHVLNFMFGAVHEEWVTKTSMKQWHDQLLKVKLHCQSMYFKQHKRTVKALTVAGMWGSARVCTPFCLAGGLLDAGLAAAGLDELGAALFRAPAVPFDALPGDLQP